jgi:hypothetical protein
LKPGLFTVISLFAISLSCQSATLPLKSCVAIDQPVERLACYDKLAGRLPAETGKAGDTAPGAVDPVEPKTEIIAPATPAVTPTVPAVEPTPEAEAIFGLEHRQKPDEERPDELQLKWTKKKKDAYDKWIITLENGQVWHQTDSRHFNFINSEQWVVISRGVLGSFFLAEPDRKGWIRVKRVK